MTRSLYIAANLYFKSLFWANLHHKKIKIGPRYHKGACLSLNAKKSENVYF